MITEEDLVKQFTIVLNYSFPQLGECLRHCYIKVIQSSLRKYCDRPLPYIGIYCPDSMIAVVKEQKDVLKDVAQHHLLCVTLARE